MKHIVRLLVVLVIACGIGLGIYFVARDNAPFVLSEYLIEENNLKKQHNENLFSLKENLDSTSENYSAFCQYEEIYKGLEISAKTYETILNSVSLDKNEVNKIKNNFNAFNEKLKTLDNSVTLMKNYLDPEKTENPATSEERSRERKVNLDFKSVIEQFLVVNDYFEDLTLKKVYNNKCFDNLINLHIAKNLIAKNCVNSNNKNYGLLLGVQNKIQAFCDKNQNASKDTVKFSILFAGYNKNSWNGKFKEYFDNDEVIASENEVKVADFNKLLDYLNMGVYYEKV